MSRVLSSALLFMLIASPVIAGELLMNNSEEVFVGLQIVFSEPVSLLGYGDELTHAEPETESSEFVLSEGVVEPYESQWLSWKPENAQIISHKWLAEDDLADWSWSVLIDWDAIPHQYSYENQLIPPAEYWNRGHSLPLDPGNWGLAGSDVKGVKLLCSEGGLFIRWETHSASIQGSYAYGIHLWQYPQVLLAATADPIARTVHVGLMQNDVWETLEGALVELGTDSLVLWIPEPLVLCTENSPLFCWDIIPMLEYNGDKGYEVFELPLQALGDALSRCEEAGSEEEGS